MISGASVEFVVEPAGDAAPIERVVIENYGQAETKGNYYARDFSIAMMTTADGIKEPIELCKGTLKAELGPQQFKFPPVKAKYIPTADHLRLPYRLLRAG